MRKLLLILVFLQYLVVTQAQSIAVNPAGSTQSGYDAEQLLKNVLLGGACSTATNFQLKDNPFEPFPNANRSWGYFSKGNSNFPFTDGIVLTTGFAKKAEGPDTGLIVSDGSFDWVGDADADILALIYTNNATVFEFDFVPQGNQISFNYIFASEEYPTYACTSFNDVFAFIISGPGITPDPGLSGKNIALLPNGNPVTINTVNDQGCGDINYYVPGAPNNYFTDIQYGGRTIPLTAQSPVIAGQTYHIRLLVADAMDTAYDSAVFLEGGSFNLGSVITDENGVVLGDNLYLCGVDDYTLHVNVDASTGYTIQWFLNNTPIPGATNNSLAINQSGTYKVEVSIGSCTASDEINVTFGELQTNGDTFTLEKVDTDGNGTEVFNLTDVQPMVLNNPTNANFVYYTTQADAQNQINPISNPTAYTAADQTIVWARVISVLGADCYKIVKIILKVNPYCINPEPACSNDEGFGLNIPFLGNGDIPTSAPPGPNYDCLYNQPYPRFYYFKIAESGNLYFNLNQYTQPNQQGTPIDVDFIVWGPFSEVPCNFQDLQQVVSCSYSASAFEYVSIPNAQAGEYYIMMITNYAGSYGQFGYVNLIFDTQNSTGSFDCSIVTGDRTYGECDNDQDGQVEFNLATIASDLTDGNPGLAIKFYSVEDDALNDTGNNVIPTGPFTVTTATNPTTIFAQVKDSTGSVIKVWTVHLKINDGVEGAHDAEISSCESNGEGEGTVDLTSANVIDNPGQYEITYYESEQDAIAGNNQFIPNPTAYQTGSTTVYVRIENSEGCFVVVRIIIEITGLEVDLGDDFSMCDGEAVLTASGDFGEGVTFTWSLNGTVIAGANSSTLTITGPGTYTVVVETQEGCSGSDTVIVGTEELIIDLGDDFTMCEGVAELTASGAEEFQSAVYSWTLNGNTIPNESGSTIIVNQPGTYTVTVETSWGCTGTDTIVIETTELNIDLGDDFTMCEGEATLTAIGAGEYNSAIYVWTINGVVIDDADGQTITVTEPGTYTVTVETEWGCTGTDTVVVGVGELDIDLGEDFSMCEGEREVTVNGTQGYETTTYVWTENGNIIEGANGPSIIITHPGTYTVTVETEWGCTDTDTVVVLQGEGPTITGITYGPDYIQVHATGGSEPYQYSLSGVVWQNSNQFNYIQSGTYTVYVRSAEGCVSTMQFVVFQIPTMFTPNGDGINDTWNIPGLEIYPGSNVVIYDRNGRLVYQAELTSTTIWNGYYMNGQKAPTQDYWYVIDLTDGRRITGHVTVKSRGEKN